MSSAFSLTLVQAGSTDEFRQSEKVDNSSFADFIRAQGFTGLEIEPDTNPKVMVYYDPDNPALAVLEPGHAGRSWRFLSSAGLFHVLASCF
jgi:hypothetical protein